MTAITNTADLQTIPNWVVFSIEPQSGGGKPRKVPYIPGTQRPAKSNDPTTWRTHAEAIADAEQTGRTPAVALTPDMSLTMVDIDDQTDHPLIARLDSYTERSISGNGIHILVHGRPPAGFTVPAGVEVYPRDVNRFLILTGTIIAGRDAIEDRTDTLAQLFPARSRTHRLPDPALLLDDVELLQRARGARNGSDFAALFDRGETDAYGNDDSRADLALCSMLAFWSQDPAQIDRLFRQSALFRDKWERRADYRSATMSKALQRSGTYTPPTAPESCMGASKDQDAASGTDPCAGVRDELAALRAENAALKAENAELRADRDRLSRLQSATMTMFRSRDLQAGEKIVGLVSLFEVEAAVSHGATDPDGWTDTPLDRIAESAGCSPKVAGKHQATVATTGLIEAETVSRRDPQTGEIKKHRRIRLPVPTPDAPAPTLPDRILALADATPTRDPAKQRWGGLRTCPDCGDVGTVTTTTTACRGCGQVLRTTESEQPPDFPTGPLALSKTCGSSDPSMGQVVLSGKRARAAQDLALREPAWLDDAPDPWDTSLPESGSLPTLFSLDDLAPPGPSHHFVAD